MIRFFKNTTLFLTGLIIIFSINFTINQLIIKKNKVKINESKILIIGDSHTRKAINPLLFNDCQSISQQGEPYVITYWKLKALINKINPDTVLIGFAPHNLSDFNDLKFSDKTWSHTMFERIYLIEDLKSLTNILIDYKGYYTFLLKRLCLFPRINHIYFLGGYKNSTYSNLSNTNHTIKRHFYFQDKICNISETSINYLDSIINLCISNNTTPILVNTPTHRLYKEKIPKEMLLVFDIEKKRFSNNNILTLEDTINYTDSLFFNSNHLNDYGSYIFTKKIINDLQKTHQSK